MANPQAILDKVIRNMEQRGYYNPGNSLGSNPGYPAAGVQIAQVGATLQLTQANTHVITVSYVPKAVQSPMGGVDPSVSPYLGIGIAAPGSLQMQGQSGDNTMASIMTDQSAAELLLELSGYANDVLVTAGSGTVLARLRGLDSLQGMGS